MKVLFLIFLCVKAVEAELTPARRRACRPRNRRKAVFSAAQTAMIELV